MAEKHSDDYSPLIELFRESGRNVKSYGEKSETFDAKNETARQKKIKNDNLISDQRMKRGTLITLFAFLGIETIIIFVVVFFQGFRVGGFHIEEWCFSLLTTATLIQIAYMIRIAVKHLFP